MKKEMTMEDFWKLKESSKLTIVDFYADWCVPCQSMKSIIHEVALEHEDKVDVYAANAEDLDELALQMKVRNLPTILFMKNGEVIKRVAGTMTKDALIDLINQLA